MTTPDPAAALGRALADATAAVEDTLAQGDDAVFALVVALDEALTTTSSFGRSLAGLLVAGAPGEVVAADLRLCAETLEQRGRELSARRAELGALRAGEQAMRERAAEAEQLRVELAELHRVERLANSLEQLRSARRALQEGGATASAVAQEERALADAARHALEAVERLGDDLREDVRAALARRTDAAARLPELEAELATARADADRDQAEVDRLTTEIESSRLRHQTVRSQLAELAEGWRTHLDADREIAAVLLRIVRDPAPDAAGAHPDTAVVQEITDHIAGHLQQLDGLLGGLLATGEQQDRRDHARRRPGSGDPALSDSSTAQVPSSTPSPEIA
jgi:hypothetical protein